MFNFKVLDKIAFSIVIAMCRFSKGCDSAKLQITSIISCKGQPFYTLQYTKIIRLQNTTILYTIMCKIFLHLVGWLSVYAMVHISCYSYVYICDMTVILNIVSLQLRHVESIQQI